MEPLDAALSMPRGAVWRRAALQVNPFAYHVVNASAPPEPTPEAYDTALASALVSAGVEIVGITDHWRVRESEELRQRLVTRGITVFPGFEATSSDGVHVLVLFDPTATVDEVERRISECGVDATTGHSLPCDFPLTELLGRARRWSAVAVPAHIGSGAGLLQKLSGQPRVRAWTSPDLHAVALSGDPGAPYRNIVRGTDPAYARDHELAVLHACDINTAADVTKPYATTWIKLSSATAAGLDMAFRSAQTRVSRDDPDERRALHLTAVAWQGGFLDGVGLRLNEGMNVLIGGRGSGKSTVLESIRFALGIQPVTPRGREQHAQVVSQVLGTAAKVTLLAECGQPSRQVLRVERTVGGAPRVYNHTTGEALSATPADLLPGVEVYGQRELAEVADDKARQTDLLERLLPAPSGDRTTEVLRALAGNRKRLLDLDAELARVDDRLNRLDVVTEKLRAYADTGAPAALAAQRLQQRERGLLETADQRVVEAGIGVEALRDAAGLDTAFLSPAARDGLPNASVLVEVEAVLAQLRDDLLRLSQPADARVGSAREQLAALTQSWEAATADNDQRLEAVLRSLRAAGVDAGDYLPLIAERDALLPLGEEPPRLRQQREALLQERRTLLDELEERVGERTRALDRAGRVVGRELALLRVSVSQRLDVAAVVALLRENLSGRLDKVEEVLQRGQIDSGRALADLARQGATALMEVLGLPEGQARRLADSDSELLLTLEEQVASPVPVIELDIAESGSSVWRPLEALSTGQKATALLLLLLVSGNAPLLVDQPEDDLDNRFVSEGIVPRLRDDKAKRQFVLSSHNANIPVLADADLIAALSTERDGSRLRAVLPTARVGSLDDAPVRVLVEELLEGGKTAFETRRYRYGF